ncbi:MAG: GNAT family N-acetyltransferase, partial [Candidatus Omnitrophica bacterium]|nr:GNAT family N-acetyltransferase [Candidatus Omnitrophota bacterium]
FDPHSDTIPVPYAMRGEQERLRKLLQIYKRSSATWVSHAKYLDPKRLFCLVVPAWLKKKLHGDTSVYEEISTFPDIPEALRGKEVIISIDHDFLADSAWHPNPSDEEIQQNIALLFSQLRKCGIQPVFIHHTPSLGVTGMKRFEPLIHSEIENNACAFTEKPTSLTPPVPPASSSGPQAGVGKSLVDKLKIQVPENWDPTIRSPLPRFKPQLIKEALREGLTRDDGRVLLSICEILNVAPEEVVSVNIELAQEGQSYAVFRGELTLSNGERKYFVVDAPLNEVTNAKITEDYNNLSLLHREHKFRLIPQPYTLAEGNITDTEGHKVALAFFIGEWLKDYQELHRDNTVNGPNLYILPNYIQRKETGSDIGAIFNAEQSRAIRIAIISLLTQIYALTYDGNTGLSVMDIDVNAGDFMVKVTEEGAFDVRMITARRLQRLTPQEFLEYLRTHTSTEWIETRIAEGQVEATAKEFRLWQDPSEITEAIKVGLGQIGFDASIFGLTGVDTTKATAQGAAVPATPETIVAPEVSKALCVTGDTLLPVIRLGENGKWKMENGTMGGLNGKSNIREFKGLSAGDIICQKDLPINQCISKERTLWFDKPITQGNSLNPFKHSREPGKTNKSREEEFSDYRKGFCIRDIGVGRNQLPIRLSTHKPERGLAQGDIFNYSSTNSDDSLSPLNPFSILHSQFSIENIPIIEVQPGDYVLSLNEETQTIEPHRINALLDMGVKPVYRLTTASGRSIKTTINHPYLVKVQGKEVQGARCEVPGLPSTEHIAPITSKWIKVSGLKVGDEIAVPRLDLSSAVGIFSSINSVNDNISPFKIKTDTVLPNSKSMCSRREINQGFGKGQRFTRRDIQPNLFNNAFLKLRREFSEFTFTNRRELNFFNNWLAQAIPSLLLIFSKGTKPNFLASSIPFLSFNINLGLRGRCSSMASISQPTGLWNIYSLLETCFSNFSSKAQSKSHNEYVSNTKYLGEPFLSTTTAALKSLEKASPDVLSSLGIDTNFSRASNLADSFADSITNDFDFIALSPSTTTKYNIVHLFLSRQFSVPEAEAAVQGLPNTEHQAPNTAILWDKIVSIEYCGYEHVYDIEVEGTHNFIGNNIFAHNTYAGVVEPPTAQGAAASATLAAIGLSGKIRAATIEDAQRIAKLRQLIDDEESINRGEAYYRRVITDPRYAKNILIIYEEKGKVLGYALATPLSFLSKDSKFVIKSTIAMIEEIAVDRGAQNRGIGALLFTELIKILKEKDYKGVSFTGQFPVDMAKKLNLTYKDGLWYLSPEFA